MHKYVCSCCNFSTNHKPNLERHFGTKKHKKNEICIQKEESCIHMYTQMYTQKYECKFCKKVFASNSSRCRHQSKYCKKKEADDIQTLLDLLNEKEKELCDSKEKIDELTKKLGVYYVNNGNIVQGNQNNTIQLLNYNKTDYDFLTDNDFIRCFMDNNHCVKKLIEKVHFNPKKPENMNIYISSMKGKYVMVYRDNVWQLKNRKKQIDDLYETNELVLEQWFEEYKQNHPNVIKSFTQYLKNKKNDDDLVRSVKDEVLLMLYNNRYLIKESN